MDTLAERLDSKPRTWNPETAVDVRERIAGVIDPADSDLLDLMRSRARGNRGSSPEQFRFRLVPVAREAL